MGDLSKKFTPELYEAVYQVDEEQDGMRLDQFCAIYLSSFSRESIKKKIKEGEVKIENRPFPHKASVKVYHREKIEIKTPRGELEDEYWNGEKIPLELTPEIIFDDNKLIVISKPPYMATHPTGKHLFNCATVFLENKFQQTIHSIHRLDRETSGVLLLAKNPQIAQYCSQQFENNLVHKCYLFIAHKNKDISFPVISEKRLGTQDDFSPRNFNHCFPTDSKLGKHAQTKFESLYQDDKYIIGLAFPKTGRQHQIRAHASDLGFPLLGDKLYNGDPSVFMRFKDLKANEHDHKLMQISRHALHAFALCINYPEAKTSLFQTPIPNDFKEWMNKEIPNYSPVKLGEEIQKKLNEWN